MDIGKEMAEAMNAQFNREIEAAFLYAAMGVYLNEKKLPGFAHWMHKQSEEEMGHATRFRLHLEERNGRVFYGSVPEQKDRWDSVLAVFQETLKREQDVTVEIDKLMALSRKCEDNAAEVFLRWFVTEQVEEEDSARRIIDKLELVGESGIGLLQLDDKLITRMK